tara:strand:+ start:259 stop:648 length:390 start_codon:yes stop_codon:yes gene_type:complete
LKIKYLEELEVVLANNKISKEEVCIVGSAVMTLHGLRENNDIDIILKDTVRNKIFPLKTTKLSKNIELVSFHWLHSNKKITDNEIIENKLYHTRYCGYKFVSLTLLEERKNNSQKQKDKKDLSLIRGAL